MTRFTVPCDSFADRAILKLRQFGCLPPELAKGFRGGLVFGGWTLVRQSPHSFLVEMQTDQNTGPLFGICPVLCIW